MTGVGTGKNKLEDVSFSVYYEYMVISDLDLEKIGRVVRININEALEQVVGPKLEALEEKIDGVEERLGKRIDKLAEVVNDTKVNHEKRIRKLEDEVGIDSTHMTL